MNRSSSTPNTAPGLLLRTWLGLCRRWPFVRGRNRFTRISSGNQCIRNHLLSLTEWTRTREGFEMQVSSKYDYTSFLLRLFGDLEPKTKNFVLGNMRDGEAFLDMGANVGYFGLLIAKQFPNARVVAFEPNPPIAQCLAESITRNAFDDRMKVVRHAVSDRTATLSFVVEDVNSGHSRIATSESGGDVIKVEAMVFDDWVRTNPIGCRVGCMKMDVEGAEVLALKGMMTMLQSDRPAICVEGYDNQLREFGSSLPELRALFAGIGYREVEVFDGNLYMKHESRIEDSKHGR